MVLEFLARVAGAASYHDGECDPGVPRRRRIRQRCFSVSASRARLARASFELERRMGTECSPDKCENDQWCFRNRDLCGLSPR